MLNGPVFALSDQSIGYVCLTIGASVLAICCCVFFCYMAKHD